MSSKFLLFRWLAWLLLVVFADGAAALPDCDCYFNSDCSAATPTCVYSTVGGGPQGPTDPDRSCEWRRPKPLGVPGTGCDQHFTGGGGPCDGICQVTPPVIEERESKVVIGQRGHGVVDAYGNLNVTLHGDG